MVLLLAVLGSGACELVLGPLPQPRDGTGGEGPTTSASGGAGGCCDCDGDHHLAAACGGDDCDDGDPKVHPGAAYSSTKSANPAWGFDLDCNHKIERDPTLDVALNCKPGLGLPCPSGEGYLGAVPPACGDSAPWGKCLQNGVTCVQNVIDQARTMTCR